MLESRAAAADLPQPGGRRTRRREEGRARVYDPRDGGARMWDALVQLAQPRPGHRRRPRLPRHPHPGRGHHRPPHPDRRRPPQAARPTLPVTSDGLDLPPAVVRRLACDAEVIPVLLGSHGEVLDVGRATRTVTVPIWNALVVRDRHCAFPGCHRPPVMCHAHHIRHWADLGETELDNLVLLCGHHHRTIHHTPWQIRINPKDRKPEFSPPPRHGKTKEMDPISTTERLTDAYQRRAVGTNSCTGTAITRGRVLVFGLLMSAIAVALVCDHLRGRAPAPPSPTRRRRLEPASRLRPARHRRARHRRRPRRSLRHRWTPTSGRAHRDPHRRLQRGLAPGDPALERARPSVLGDHHLPVRRLPRLHAVLDVPGTSSGPASSAPWCCGLWRVRGVAGRGLPLGALRRPRQGAWRRRSHLRGRTRGDAVTRRSSACRSRPTRSHRRW